MLPALNMHVEWLTYACNLHVHYIHVACNVHEIWDIFTYHVTCLCMLDAFLSHGIGSEIVVTVYSCYMHAAASFSHIGVSK